MAKLAIKKASTDVTVYLFIQASNVTTGAGLTGLTFETASLVASYVRPLAARAALSLATQTVDGAHSDGGFVEVDATNMPGVYRLDLPDAVCATGVPSVVVMLKGAANMAPVLLEIQLTDFDLNDASPNVTVNDMATDAITAAALKADAVTEIQNGLALEATLTAIKGAGWTDETLAKIVTDIAAISAGSSATPQQIWEYATRVLTAGTNIDLSSLATAANLAAVKSVADDILEDTGTTLPATLATLAGYTDGIAGDVWSSPIRTLTVPAVAAAATEDGTTLTLYKDADINIEFTGLTIPTGAKKVVFTIKDNLDDADTASALQATYQLTAVPAETHTLNYINSAVPPVLTTPVTFTVDTDSVEFDMTAAAAYYLPRYERGYLHWDLKLITATTVQILQQGLVQILGTSTRAVT